MKEQVDLTNCDKEPIQYLGKIQSYGFLVAVSADGTVKYLSDNIGKFLSLSFSDLLNKPLNFLNDHIEFSGSINFFDFCCKSGQPAKPGEDFSTTLRVLIAGKPFYLVVNKSSDLFILEFLPSSQPNELTSVVFNMASSILSADNLEELYNRAAFEIKSLIGYDRVMIYKFLPNGSGEVVGEAVNENMEPFMWQRYPESDIPRQARALYKLNRMRLIADVNSDPVDVVGAPGAQHFDMTYCTLRAVSPTHILYCKNMGLGSSFSISIIVEDELWGLITCHNATSKHIDYNVRQSAMLLNSVISGRIANKTNEINRLLETHFQKEILMLQYHLSIHNSVPEALTKVDTNLKDVTNADGVALVYKGKIFIIGITPSTEDVKHIADWASAKINGDHIVTNEFSKLYPAAVGFSEKASGVLITSLGNENKDLIIWFKKETPKTILWAGEPKKGEIADDASEGGVKIVPRVSFKVWREFVKHTSEEWKNEEINAAMRISQIIRDIAFKKAEEQLPVNNRLKEAYDELDSFTYTVSHDLRNPIGVIKNYAQFLIHSNAATDERSKTIVNNIIAGSDKLTNMLQSLLELSKMSRQEITNEPVDMKEVIKNIINEQKLTGRYSNTEVVLGDQPLLKGNSLLIYHIFSNIISNAFKYTSTQEAPQVRIKGYAKDSTIVYEVEDNGIGISTNKPDDAFKLFTRLENAGEFEGTGAGLAIVKKNVEKLGGNVSFKNAEPNGTIFYLTFYNQEPDDASE